MKKDMMDIYSYIIDDKDYILDVANEEQWDEFYEQNSDSSSCLSKNMSRSSLWSFIDDLETQHLYENILTNVRKYNRQVTLPFRCDSPTQRRYLNLTIKPLKNNHVQFISKIEKIENRKYVPLMDTNRKTTEEFLSVCSMCKKIKLEENHWEEVEEAVSILKLFEKERLPKLTHGICPKCKDIYLAEVKKFMDELDS